MAKDELVWAGERPKVAELIADFKGCTPWGDGNWNRVADNEAVRFSRWANQNPDGKKHDRPGRPAFPFDGASDTRIPLADSVVNENVAVCCAAFWRAMIRPKMGIKEGSAYAVKLADYFINTLLYHELVREVELSEQYRSTLGWVVIHARWNREIVLQRRTVKMEDLVAVAQAADNQGQPPQGQEPVGGPGEISPLGMLPMMIMDPTMDDQTAELIQVGYLAYAEQAVERVLKVKLPPLSTGTLKQLVKDLRERGQGEVPIPTVAKNQPELVALKPWDEIFVPNSCTDIQKAPRTFRRVWMSELELRSRILTEGWEPKWVEEAVKHKGEYSTWTAQSTAPTSPPTLLVDAMSSSPTSWTQTQNINDDLIEVIYACYRGLDADNVPGVYVTVFHAAVCDDPDKPGRELYAEHGLLEAGRGDYPYVSGQRENCSRCITQARGVPQVAATWQREIKVQRDGLIDHTSLGVTPPLLVPKGAMGIKLKFAPAAQNEVTPGREPRFMEIPQAGTPLAMELMQVVGMDVDNYFGRMAAEVLPARVQIKQGMLTQPFLLMWSRALQMMVDLAQQHMPDADFATITGAPPGWLEAGRDTIGLLAVDLHFDVRELDQEFVLAQLDTINKTVLPGDVAGTIDRAKYTKLQLRAISPALARELVADQGEASQRIFKAVQNDIALMFLGNEPDYVEMDPTAQTKLGFASQIVGGNPTYQQALQQGGRFGELMQKWAMNLQFSITQEQNKQVGAIGVKPQAMGAGQNGGGAMMGR